MKRFMKKMPLLLTTSLLSLGALSSAQAHVLIFKARLTSSTRIDSKGKKTSKTYPTSSDRLLLVLDLDTDFVRESAANNTDTVSIVLDENTKSFQSGPSGDDGNTQGHSQCTKFEFFDNQKSFYLFLQDTQNFGDSGTDLGSIFATGACTLNQAIGGKRVSSIPKNFTTNQYRGDGNTFKTNTFFAEYDATMTKAVNDYLASNNIKSTKGSEESTTIKAAKSWLVSTYLPRKTAYPNKFPTK